MMNPLNVLGWEWRTTPPGPTGDPAEDGPEVRYRAWLVDDEPLDLILDATPQRQARSPLGADLVTPFGWLRPETEHWYHEHLALLQQNIPPATRRALAVCAYCAEPDHGSIAAIITLNNSVVSWYDLAYNDGNTYNMLDEGRNEYFPTVVPFHFSVSQYRHVLTEMCGRCSPGR